MCVRARETKRKTKESEGQCRNGKAKRRARRTNDHDAVRMRVRPSLSRSGRAHFLSYTSAAYLDGASFR